MIDAGGAFPHVPAPYPVDLKPSFSLFLALRYLKPKRSFLSVITIITLLGVTIGIAVLMVVIAIMTGFREELQERILGHDAHLFISFRGGLVEDPDGLEAQVKAQPGIKAVAPYVMGPALVEFSGEINPGQLRGIDPEKEDQLLGVRRYIKQGQYDLDGDKCILGIELARSLRIRVGDRVLVHGPGNLREVMHQLREEEKKKPEERSLENIRTLIQPTELEVTGLFETGEFNYDQQFFLLPLNVAQEIYGFEGQIHGVAAQTDNPMLAELYKEPLQRSLGDEYQVASWIDQNQSFFRAVDFERVMMYFILSLVVVVAGFSITNTLITVSFQKRKDIGLLKALGATPGKIVRIFVNQGVVVGLLGNVLGFTAGGLIIYFRRHIQQGIEYLVGHELFQKEVYQLNGLPAKVVITDMAIIASISFVVCVLAAMIPAWFAARMDPVKALRDE